MSKLNYKTILPFAVVVAALCLGITAGLVRLGGERIARDVTIGGVKVGGLTKAEACESVSREAAHRLGRSVTIKAGKRRWSGAFVDLGVHADVQNAVDRAYQVGRNGNILSRMWALLASPDVDIKLSYLLDRKTLAPTLEKIAQAIDIPHKDASLSVADGVFSVRPEEIGVKLDKKATAERFQQAAEAGSLSMDARVMMDVPDVKAAELNRIDSVLASYTTRFPAFRRERTHNIRMAATKVDGALIKSGEVFSYNDIVGPRLKSLGFKDAPIFVKGKLVPGTGGGICQLSSTIYNAALLANLKIIERSHHSSTVPYVPVGRDATVAYGYRDLRFRNTTSSPIYISSKMSGSYLHVNFYGSSCDKADVSVVVQNAGKLKATVYRIVKVDGKVVSRERVSNDKYRPAEPMTVAAKPKKHPQTGEVPTKHSNDTSSPRQASTAEG